MASILRDEAATLMHYGQNNFGCIFFSKLQSSMKLEIMRLPAFSVKNKMIYDLFNLQFEVSLIGA